MIWCLINVHAPSGVFFSLTITFQPIFDFGVMLE
jgi:hypothetical protein